MNSRRSGVECHEGELSILEITRFLRGGWKIILLSGVCGLTIAIFYLLAASKVYEAKAQVVMAQIASVNQFSYQGVSIEEPAKLISRLMSPSFLPANIKNICGVGGELLEGNAPVRPLESVKLSVSQANTVELTVYGATQEAAANCATNIFELIKSTQAQLVDPYFKVMKEKLLEDEDRLNKLRNFLTSSSKSDSSSAAFYLLNLDEIRQVQAEISTIKNILSSSANQGAHLVAPIYASGTPIAPKKLLSLIIGLFGGFLFGFICALGRQALINFKGSRRSEI